MATIRARWELTIVAPISALPPVPMPLMFRCPAALIASWAVAAVTVLPLIATFFGCFTVDRAAFYDGQKIIPRRNLSDNNHGNHTHPPRIATTLTICEPYISDPLKKGGLFPITFHRC